jgi:hypothetical protein
MHIHTQMDTYWIHSKHIGLHIGCHRCQWQLAGAAETNFEGYGGKRLLHPQAVQARVLEQSTCSVIPTKQQIIAGPAVADHRADTPI